MNNGWLEGCIIIVYIEGSCFYVVSLYCCLVTVAFAKQMSLDLHRVYQLTSYHCIDPLFPCRWRNHNGKVGTQGTNRQVEQVVQSAVQKKNKHRSHISSIHEKLFCMKSGQCLIVCVCVSVCVCECV